MRRLAIIPFIIFSLSSFDLPEMFEVIKHVETNNNPNIIGDNGKAYGIVQIHKICVDDVNRIYGTCYTHEDSFDEECAREIFYLYLQYGKERYKRKYGVYPSEEVLVRMWNFGIYQKQYKNGYYKKYLKYKKLIQNTKNR